MPQAEGKVTRLNDLLDKIKPYDHLPQMHRRNGGVDKRGPGCNSRKVYGHGFSP